jgi:hypothetical protein
MSVTLSSEHFGLKFARKCILVGWVTTPESAVTFTKSALTLFRYSAIEDHCAQVWQLYNPGLLSGTKMTALEWVGYNNDMK